jgi:hypothetical protein
MLNLVTQVKKRQVDEANANIDSLNQSVAVAIARLTQYQKLLGKAVSLDANGLPILSVGSTLQVANNAPGDEAGLGLIQNEVDQLLSLDKAHDYQEKAGIASTVAGILHSMPELQNGGIYSYVHMGGMHLGNAANALASYLSLLSGNASFNANRQGMLGSYQRRQDEWVFQSRLALEDIKQINKQIIAAQIRLDIAKKEFNNHLKQVDNSQAVDDFMRDKYTNQELYSWMMGRISSVYFTCYQLAYDTAKRAEKAFQKELGLEATDSNFIQYGYWDSLKKGLLSGENLSLDLKRMEVAYLEQNKRELEITKHISLALLDPTKLLDLKENGECILDLPEALFDLDYPGHYMRRVKSMSITIPCVAGPYTNINCTLTLLKHSVRTKAGLINNQYVRSGRDDKRFVDSQGSVQSIATSHGQNDSGLFEVNFHDERYLPFEGAGAIGTWRLQLPQACNAFDMNTISDVVMHLKYTARDGGETLREVAPAAATPSQGVCLISACHQFPSEWHRFLNPDGAPSAQTLEFDLGANQFPFILRRNKIEITQVDIFVQPVDGADLSSIANSPVASVTLTPPKPNQPLANSVNLTDDSTYGGMLHAVAVDSSNPLAKLVLSDKAASTKWTMSIPGIPDTDGKITGYPVTSTLVKDVIVVCHYALEKSQAR